MKRNGGGVIWEGKVLFPKNWFGVEESREILRHSESEEFLTFGTVLVLDKLSESWHMTKLSRALTLSFSSKTTGFKFLTFGTFLVLGLDNLEGGVG